MRSHPPRASLTRPLFALLAVALVATGCTSGPGPQPPPGRLPTAQFQPLPDVAPGLTEYAESMATDGKRAVLATGVYGNQTTVGFLHSDDAGATWTRGTLAAEAAAQRLPGERVGRLAALKTADRTLWFGLSSAEGALYSWTSPDGATWSRAPLTGIDPKTASISDVVASAEAGLVLVGSTLEPGVGTKRKAAVWRSDDGLTWTSAKLSVEGDLDTVAARGSTLVAAGRVTLPGMNDKGLLERALAVRSVDGGRTWASVSVLEPADSAGFVTFVSSVAASEAGFVLVGGYEAFVGRQALYRSWGATSGDGAAWQPVVVSGRSDSTLSTASSVVRVGAADVVAIRDTVEGRRVVRLERLQGKQWAPASRLPNEIADGWLGPQLALSPTTALLAVALPGRPNQPQLWRTTDGGATYAAVGLPAWPAASPVIEPARLAARRVLGDAQGQDVSWPRGADGTLGVPVSLNAAPGVSIGGVAEAPSATLLWGTRAAHGTRHAQTWLDTGTGAPAVTDGAAFNAVEAYHSSSINQAIWAHGRWVAVGDRSTNGPVRAHALAVTSTDGKKWTPGKAASTISTGDAFSDGSKLTDLEGLENNRRSMASVAEAPVGVVAVGSRDADGTSRATYWTTDQGITTWKLADLPSEGLESSYASGVRAHGNTLVAIGGGTKKGAKEGSGYVWTSTDAGKTWAMQPLGTTTDAQPLLLATGTSGFVVVQGRDHDRALDGWQSADGTTWTPLAVDLPGRNPETRVSVRDLEGGGDGVDLLLRVYDADDARAVIHHVKVG